MLPGFPSPSHVSELMSLLLLPLSNSPVTNFPVNNNSILIHFLLIVEHTLITLVCSVQLFPGQFRLMWVELPPVKQLRQIIDQWPFLPTKSTFVNCCFPFWDCHFFRAYLIFVPGVGVLAQSLEPCSLYWFPPCCVPLYWLLSLLP